MSKPSMLVFVLVAGFATHSECAVRSTASTSPQQAVKESPDSPAGVVRRFLLAMAKRDLTELEEVALPDADLSLLVKNDAVSDAQLEEIGAIQFSFLHLGDEVAVPTSKGPESVVMDKNRINENRQQLTYKGNPIPFDVVRTEGRWKVNPRPLIAARKAAAAILELPDWSVDESETTSLAQPFKLVGYQFQPPAGFRFIKSGKPEDQVNVSYWAGKIREDKSYPLLLVSILTTPDDGAQYTIDRAIKETLDTYVKGHEAASSTPTERGVINGSQFVRATWEGVVPAGAQNGMAGRRMHAIVYITIQGQQIIQIVCLDAAPHHPEALEQAHLAASTFRVSRRDAAKW
ncbi:MAG: hypothetical protein R3C19_12115 [Planctomycetaceae bacterium]